MRNWDAVWRSARLRLQQLKNLPDQVRVVAAVRYLPVAVQKHVGGDSPDAIPLADSAVLVVDVRERKPVLLAEFIGLLIRSLHGYADDLMPLLLEFRLVRGLQLR